MLNKNYAAAALYAKPEIMFTVDGYNRRLGLLTSYTYNVKEEVPPPLNLYVKIMDITDYIDNLKLLNNLVQSACGMLQDKHKDIINRTFFKRENKETVMREMKMNLPSFKYFKRAGIEKIAYYLDMFGLTDERFFKLFNEEPLIVRCYGEVLEAVNNNINTAEKFVCEGYQ